MDSLAALRDQAVRNPADMGALERYCTAAVPDYLDEAVQHLAEIVSVPFAHEAQRLFELRLLALLRENQGRKQHGLNVGSPGTSLKDTEFAFARDELEKLAAAAETFLARKPHVSHAKVMRGEALTCLGRLPEAHAQFAELTTYKDNLTASESVDFSPAFHAGLEAMDPTQALPATQVASAGTIGARAIFVAGDGAYFARYGRKMLRSLRDRDISVALHLMDCRPEYVSELPPTFHVTTENTGLTGDAARSHYHAVRFVRLWEFRKRHPRTAIWAFDMDTVFTGPLAPLFDLLAGGDLTPHFLTARMEPRNKIAAGMLGASPTENASRYLHRVASYISFMYAHGRLSWGTDQVALYAVLSLFPDPLVCTALAGQERVIRDPKA